MDNKNQEKVYRANDKENRKFCDIFDKLAFDRKYNNHLKSQTHINILRERQQ